MGNMFNFAHEDAQGIIRNGFVAAGVLFIAIGTRSLQSVAYKILCMPCAMVCSQVCGQEDGHEKKYDNLEWEVNPSSPKLNWWNIAETSWEEAWHLCGYRNVWTALMGSILRLVIFNWMQPAIFLLAIFAYYPKLSHTQQMFGLFVASREVFYFLLSIVSLYKHPSTLLVNLHATQGMDHCQKKYYMSLWMYTFNPEKTMLMWIFGEKEIRYHPEGLICAFVFLPVCDIAGLVAFMMGVVSGELLNKAILLISYGITATGGISMLVILTLHNCFGYNFF